MSKADTHGIDEQEMKKPVTQADINAAREALSIATSLLLSPYSEQGNCGKSGDKAFYANFLMRMNVEIGNKIPTAGVSITDRINFYINPHFFLGLGVAGCMEQQELIIHEVEHIVYLHPLRSKELTANGKSQNDHRLYNIAADANINIPLTTLTEKLGVTIERLNAQLKEYGSDEVLSDKDASDVHFWKLKTFQEEMGDKLPKGMGEGEDGECDDHSTWEESEANEELAKAVVKEASNKAAEATGAGNMPSHIQKQLNELNRSLVDWKRQLQQFAVRTVKFARERTRSKRNRRTGILFAGSRKEPKVKLALIGDESGSMSDEQVVQFFSEIDKIASMGVEILYIPMDSEAGEVITYKKGMKLSRTRCGGTYYGPGLEKAAGLGVDGAIIFGDFDCADQPKKPKYPVLWCGINTKSPAPASFGKVIYVETKGK